LGDDVTLTDEEGRSNSLIQFEKAKRIPKWTPDTCAMCLHVARTEEWARQHHMDVFGRTVPYDARTGRYGYENGCDRNCPYLTKSMMMLG